MTTQRYPVSAIRDAWYVYGLDAGRFDVVHRIIATGHTTHAAYRADLSPVARAAYDNIVQRRAAVNPCQKARFGDTRHPGATKSANWYL